MICWFSAITIGWLCCRLVIHAASWNITGLLLKTCSESNILGWIFIRSITLEMVCSWISSVTIAKCISFIYGILGTFSKWSDISLFSVNCIVKFYCFLYSYLQLLMGWGFSISGKIWRAIRIISIFLFIKKLDVLNVLLSTSFW